MRFRKKIFFIIPLFLFWDVSYAQIKDTSEPVLKYKPDEILFFCPDTISCKIFTLYVPYNLRENEYPEKFVANEREVLHGKFIGLKVDFNKFHLKGNIYKYNGDGKKIKCIVVNGYSYYFRKHHDLPLDPKDFPNLEEINITANLCWPENIGDFKQIKHLYLLSSFIGSGGDDSNWGGRTVCHYNLPNSIYKLENLEELYLDHDYPIRSEIKNLKKLKIFFFNRHGYSDAVDIGQIYCPFTVVNNSKLLIPNRNQVLSNSGLNYLFLDRLFLFACLDSIKFTELNKIQERNLYDTINIEESYSNKVLQIDHYKFRTQREGLLTDTLFKESKWMRQDSSSDFYRRKMMEIYKNGLLQPQDCYDTIMWVRYLSIDTSEYARTKEIDIIYKCIHFNSIDDFEIKIGGVEKFVSYYKRYGIIESYNNDAYRSYHYKRGKLIDAKGISINHNYQQKDEFEPFFNFNEREINDLYTEKINLPYVDY
jgi:hypothetical protein